MTTTNKAGKLAIVNRNGRMEYRCNVQNGSVTSQIYLDSSFNPATKINPPARGDKIFSSIACSPKMLSKDVSSHIKNLYDKNFATRAKAAWFLGAAGESSLFAVPHLMRLLSDRDSWGNGHLRVGDIAFWALKRIGRASIPALKAKLNTNDIFQLKMIVQLLHKFGVTNILNPVILNKILNNDTKTVRITTIRLLLVTHKKSHVAVPVLIRMLGDKDKDVVIEAVKALGIIGQKALKAVITALDDKRRSVRWGAAMVLAIMRSNAFPAVNSLIKLLSDTDEKVRCVAMCALKGIGNSVIPFLIKALKSGNNKMRVGVAMLLGEIKGNDNQIINSLILSLGDDSKDVRKSVARALVKFGVKIVPELLKALKNPKELTRINAISILGHLKPKDKAVVDVLIKMLKDSSKNVRIEAAKTIEKIGSFANKAIPSLLEMLRLSTNLEEHYRHRTNWTHKIFDEANAAIWALVNMETYVFYYLDREINDKTDLMFLTGMVIVLFNAKASPTPLLVKCLLQQIRRRDAHPNLMIEKFFNGGIPKMKKASSLLFRMRTEEARLASKMLTVAIYEKKHVKPTFNTWYDSMGDWIRWSEFIPALNKSLREWRNGKIPTAIFFAKRFPPRKKKIKKSRKCYISLPKILLEQIKKLRIKIDTARKTLKNSPAPDIFPMLMP
ncbi:MAG: HEAT repeat domain-containing protein [Pseudomonadota bacterium]